MPTFALPRFLDTHLERRAHAGQLLIVVTDTDHNIKERRIYQDPADTLTLRGIPAIGRGVAGCIRGTNPAAVVASRSVTAT
jgi:hypothetical protein